MDNFPYLITLFIFTAVAVVIYAEKTRRNAKAALEDEKPSEVRMAAEHSPAGETMSDWMVEGRAASKANK